jgi:4-alpha-glucanotransferase
LRQLAEAYGVITSYERVNGETWHAAEDAVRAVLGSLGSPVRDAVEAGAALRALRADEAARVLEPVVVVLPGGPSRVSVTLPNGVMPEQSWVTLELESGQISRHRLSPVFAATGPAGQGEVDLALLENIPFGSHALVIEAPRLAARARLLVAPPCPAPRRGWGAFMPLHAVRSERDWGIGSYTDLAELAGWVSELGGDFVGTLPLYPVSGQPPIDPSPYLPISRLAYNELFVDPTASPELAHAPDVRAELDSEAWTRELTGLRARPRVDYDAVATRRHAVLFRLATVLLETPSTRRDAFGGFAAAHPELVAYADYRAGRKEGGPSGDSAQDRASCFLYEQWLAHEQLSAAAGAGAPLYGDLPIGVRPDGFDTTWAADAFADGVSGGAPPDDFFAGGQNWGFRPLHPEQMRKDGYRYFIDCLRRACRHVDVLRIDHVAGLHRLFWIPDGMDAADGVYVRYHGDELRALICLEAARSGTAVVGEDLGTVPSSVRSALGDDGMLRTWAMQFEVTPNVPLPDPPAAAMAQWSTHDLPRFRTFFDEGPAGWQPGGLARWREAVLAADPSAEQTADAALQVCLAHLATGPAELLLVDLEEFWGEDEPQNRPGTGPEAKNWTRRAAVSLHGMRADAGRTRFLASLRERRAEAAPVQSELELEEVATP